MACGGARASRLTSVLAVVVTVTTLSLPDTRHAHLLAMWAKAAEEGRLVCGAVALLAALRRAHAAPPFQGESEPGWLRPHSLSMHPMRAD